MTSKEKTKTTDLPSISEYVEYYVCSTPVKKAYILEMVEKGLFAITYAEAKKWGDSSYLQINRDTTDSAISSYRRALMRKTGKEHTSELASQIVFYIPKPGYQSKVAKAMGITL